MPEMMVVHKEVFANLKGRVVGLVIASFSFAMLQMAAYSLFSVQKDPVYTGGSMGMAAASSAQLKHVDMGGQQSLFCFLVS